MSNDKNFVEVSVTPKVDYQFQAVAREDKGIIGGIDWNKSPITDFKTSQFNTEVGPSDIPSSPFDPKGGKQEIKNRDYKYTEGAVYPPVNEGGDSASEADTVTSTKEGGEGVAGLSVELIAIIVVCGIVTLLIIVGIIYRLSCHNKNNVADDDEDEEDDGGDLDLEKESLKKDPIEDV